MIVNNETTETTTLDAQVKNSTVLYKTNKIEAARDVRDVLLKQCREYQPWIYVMCFSSTDLNKHDTYEVSVTDKWSQKFSDEVMQIMHAVITSGSFEHQQLNMLSQTE